MAETSGFAVASLVLGILGLILGWIPFFGWIMVLLALVFGIIGLIKSKKSGKGKGMAIAGIILSIVSMVIGIFLILSIIFAGRMSMYSSPATTSGPIIETPPENIATDKTKMYASYQDVNVDYLIYKVTKTETFTEMGTAVYNKETNGKFIKVYLDITNNAKETKQIFSPRFKIRDNQDRKYDRLSDDMLYIADYLELGEELQPGLTASGAIVFEMPKNSEGLILVINGDWLSEEEVEIKLLDIENIGKDTTMNDEQDEMMRELMNQCSSPFKCTSSCSEYMDLGNKDCPKGQVCCMD